MAELSKKKTRITHKAWALVKIALLWGRKRWPLLQLRNLFSKHLKSLTHHNNVDRYLFRYGERQLSFNETPLFNIKKKKHCPPTSSMRYLLPCIAPPNVEFDFDFEMDGQDCFDEVKSYGYDDEEKDKGVDLRAEEFIAKFYV